MGWAPWWWLNPTGEGQWWAGKGFFLCPTAWILLVWAAPDLLQRQPSQHCHTPMAKAAFHPSDHTTGDRDLTDGAQLMMSLLLYFIPVYRWLNITFCLFLIPSEKHDPQSIKSGLYFSYLQTCIRFKRENKLRLSTRIVAKPGRGSVSCPGDLVTAVQRGAGPAGPGDSSFLSVSNPPPASARATASEHYSCRHCQSSPHLLANFACHRAEQRAF